MAVAISSVRIVPEEPTSVPATMSATLSSAMPAAAADSPVKAFSSEITTGMSAPPIGRTKRLPRMPAAIRTAMNRACDGPESWSMPSTMQAARIPTRSRAFTTCWPGTLIGCPETIPWSLPNAMFDPQKEIEPTTIENSVGTKVSSGIVPPIERSWRNSDHAISATAPPPTPL